MPSDGLWVLCALLVADGATFSFFTTFLLLHYGRLHEPWLVAVLGGASSAVGNIVQLLLLRWALSTRHPWMRRYAPSREKLEAALRQYPSASFLALMLARATPLPDAPLKIVAAAVGYPPPLYGLAIFLGALPYYFALALVGSKVRIPGWLLVLAAVAIVAGVAVDRWRRRGRSGA
jgi:membrane protein YqaA with SNARE-associated domain